MKRLSEKSFSLTRLHVPERSYTELETNQHSIKLKSLSCLKQPENERPQHIYNLKFSPNFTKVIMHDKCQLA